MDEHAKKWAEVASTPEAHRYIATDWYESEEFYRMSGIYSAGKLVEAIMNTPLFDKNIVKKDILEIGCGTGRTTEFLSPMFSHVYALDCAKEMIKKASDRVKANNIAWITNDGESLPLPSDTIDVVYSFVTFQHMKSQTIHKYFSEVRRVLKKTGFFIFQLPIAPIHKEPNSFNDVAFWTSDELIYALSPHFKNIKLSDSHFGLHIAQA